MGFGPKAKSRSLRGDANSTHTREFWNWRTTLTRLFVSLSLVILSGGITWAVPGPPSGLLAEVSGNTVTLSWVPPVGSPVTAYRLQAGNAPGLTNVFDGVVGLTVRVTATNVPNGSYYVRVRAIDGTGESTPSNEVLVVV